MAIGMEAPSASVLGLILTSVALAKEVAYLLFVWFCGVDAVVVGAGAALSLSAPTWHVTWALPHALWTAANFFAVTGLAGQLADANGRVRY